MSLKDKSLIDDGSEGATIAIQRAPGAPTPASGPHVSHVTPMSSFQGGSALVGGRYEVVRLLGVAGWARCIRRATPSSTRLWR